MPDLINFTNIDFEQLYLRCVASYQACIQDPDNSFLQDEVTVPINELVIKDDCVRIVMPAMDAENYHIETEITLYVDDDWFGYYRLVTDKHGDVIDDVLHFH